MKKLGKILAIVLAIATLGTVLCFSLVACNKNKIDYVIGVQAGTTGEYYVKGDADWGFDGYSNCSYKGYDNVGLATAALLSDQIDFVVIDAAPAVAIAKSDAYKGKIKVVEISLTEEDYGFGASKTKEGEALVAQINTILTTIKGNGKYDEIMNKYFGNGTPTGVTSGEKDQSKAASQLVVATNAAFAPFEYKEGGKYYGVDMELAKLIADELKMELVIEDMEFASVVTSVGKNDVDLAMSGLTINDKRKESVNFTDSYYNAAQYIIVKADCTLFDNCKTKADVEKVIANK